MKSDSRISVGLQQSIRGVDQLARNWRFARALEEGVSCYAAHRILRFAARIGLDEFFERLASMTGWQAHRLSHEHLVLDGDGLLVSVSSSRKSDYCSFFFEIWADSAGRAHAVEHAIHNQAGDARISDPTFCIRWHFRSGKGDLVSASIEEMADDVLYDEAYPELDGGVRRFIDRYLDSPEAVLVLQGPPGTGKTRLIRAILGEMSRRKGEEAQALYTGDMEALDNDEIFVKFITGGDDAFVVEDADHLLKPRVEGNENLHRFLAIADGVVRAQGRKIMFSTNLSNPGDLDDALVRPGRCFARVQLRLLSGAEVRCLLERLAGGAGPAAGAEEMRRAYSLAEIYKAHRETRPLESGTT